jgi:hypothetical protein
MSKEELPVRQYPKGHKPLPSKEEWKRQYEKLNEHLKEQNKRLGRQPHEVTPDAEERIELAGDYYRLLDEKKYWEKRLKEEPDENEKKEIKDILKEIDKEIKEKGGKLREKYEKLDRPPSKFSLPELKWIGQDILNKSFTKAKQIAYKKPGLFSTEKQRQMSFIITGVLVAQLKSNNKQVGEFLQQQHPAYKHEILFGRNSVANPGGKQSGTGLLLSNPADILSGRHFVNAAMYYKQQDQKNSKAWEFKESWFNKGLTAAEKVIGPAAAGAALTIIRKRVLGF